MNKWRIEIAELSSSSVLNQITVEASNWINALRQGRKSLGDAAEVPQGASCTILPSGIVTILDPSSRRKFTLTKENEIIPKKVISVAPPPVSEPVRKSEPPIIALKPTRKSQPPKAKSTSAKESQPPAAASEPAQKRDSVKPVRTKAVSDRPRAGARDSVIEALRRAGFPSKEDREVQKDEKAAEKPDIDREKPTPVPQEPPKPEIQKDEKAAEKPDIDREKPTPVPQELPTSKIQKDEKAAEKPDIDREKPTPVPQEPPKPKVVMQKTVSYVLDPEVRKQMKSVAVGKGLREASEPPRPEENKDSEPQRVAAIDTSANLSEPPLGNTASLMVTNEEIQSPFTSTEKSHQAVETRSERFPIKKELSPVSKYGLEILLERNEEPNDENPLIYRERCFVVPEGISRKDIEAALREQVEVLQNELRSAPKGKFVNLAAFDHRWSVQPDRPPVAVLQWKDWRGDPQIEFTDYGEPKRSQIPAAADKISTLEDAFEALHELQFLNTAAEGLDFVMKLLHEAVPAEASSACLYDINTHELRFVVVSGPGADQRKGEAVPLAAGLFGQAAKNYEVPTIVTDVNANPYFDPEVDGRPDLVANNIIYRPLARNEQLLGMLQLINRSHQPEFSRQDVNLINYVADQLAQFVHSSRMRLEKERD